MDIKKFDSKILASSHLNFLFGSGVNGSALSQFTGFKNTIAYLERILKKTVSNLEESLDEIKSEKYRDRAKKKFKEEFKELSKKIDFEKNESIKNIEKLFIIINKLVSESENRTTTTKQVNIFTLNYDMIIETVLERLGYLYNSISASNIKNHNKFFYMIGYNSMLHKYIPTYLISKLHGDIETPVLPGYEKYDTMLLANRFEILFKMKEKLLRNNSVLFVIGYSGHDEHINKILEDCVSSGLTIYWFKYDADDDVPSSIKDKINIINNDEIKDTSYVCAKMVSDLWEKSLEE